MDISETSLISKACGITIGKSSYPKATKFYDD